MISKAEVLETRERNQTSYYLKIKGDITKKLIKEWNPDDLLHRPVQYHFERGTSAETMNQVASDVAAAGWEVYFNDREFILEIW